MALLKSGERCCVVLLLLAVSGSPAVRAQEPSTPATAEEQDAESLKPKLTVGVEAKANFRHSDEFSFPVPLSPELTEQGIFALERTVNPGNHVEVSDVILYLDASWGDGL